MEIRFRGSLAKEDYLDAVRLASHPVQRRQSITFQLWVLFLSFATIFALLGVWQLANSQTISAIFFVLAMIFAVLGFKMRSAPPQTWESIKDIAAIQEGIATADALELSTSQSQARNLWSSFGGYGLYNDVLILGAQSGIFVTITRRMFTTQRDWAQFLELVSDKLPQEYRMSASISPRPTSRALLVLAVLLLTVIILIFRGGR
jgi:hypothetical protein